MREGLALILSVIEQPNTIPPFACILMTGLSNPKSINNSQPYHLVDLPVGYI